MPKLPPEQRRLASLIANDSRWAAEPDRYAATQAARDGRWQRYLDKAADLAPPGSPPEEINRRAESLRRADMRRMALASARARSERKAARTDGSQQAPEADDAA